MAKAKNKYWENQYIEYLNAEYEGDVEAEEETMETILSINIVEEGGMEGYEVITSKQSIKLLIDNEQSCCEHWGYFWCNDNPQDFIGANIIDVSITDTALNEAVLKEKDLDRNAQYFEGVVMFVDIKTERGVLQFVAYNEHNGYYGHEARVECSYLKHSETL
jgi:hypothetical protein